MHERANRAPMGRLASAVRLAVAAAFLAPTPAMAQDGAIAGRVVDPAGDGLPGVTIETTGPLPAEPRVAVTDLEGRYAVTDLRPGAYTVTFSLPGFRIVVREGVEVSARLTAAVDADLNVGHSNETELPPDGVTVFPPPGGGAALHCTFRPDGVIDDCRPVVVPPNRQRPVAPAGGIPGAARRDFPVGSTHAGPGHEARHGVAPIRTTVSRGVRVGAGQAAIWPPRRVRVHGRGSVPALAGVRRPTRDRCVTAAGRRPASTACW